MSDDFEDNTVPLLEEINEEASQQFSQIINSLIGKYEAKIPEAGLVANQILVVLSSFIGEILSSFDEDSIEVLLEHIGNNIIDSKDAYQAGEVDATTDLALMTPKGSC